MRMLNKILVPAAFMAMFLGGLLSFEARSSDDKNNSVIGLWHFVEMEWNGNRMPPRDPRLSLCFEFHSSGESRLYWTYDDGKTFCERKGVYSVSEGSILDEVVWVNPKNRSDCGDDPDMRKGRTSVTPYDWNENGQLRLTLPMGAEDIVYIWDRIEKEESVDGDENFNDAVNP